MIRLKVLQRLEFCAFFLGNYFGKLIEIFWNILPIAEIFLKTSYFLRWLGWYDNLPSQGVSIFCFGLWFFLFNRRIVFITLDNLFLSWSFDWLVVIVVRVLINAHSFQLWAHGAYWCNAFFTLDSIVIFFFLKNNAIWF